MRQPQILRSRGFAAHLPAMNCIFRVKLLLKKMLANAFYNGIILFKSIRMEPLR